MSIKKLHEDQKYIEGLATNNSIIIQAIYDKFAPKVIHYIQNNSGNATKAKDIIQETLITIYNQATTKKLELTCPFDAYFFLLCKRKWLNELKKPSNKEVTIDDASLYKDNDVAEMVFETTNLSRKETLFNTTFQNLGKACKELLTISFKIKSMEEVAKKLGVSYGYARKKKSQCIGKLTKMVKESAAYHQIKNDI